MLLAVHSHGIPLSLDGESLELTINLAQSKPLPAFTPTETWHWQSEHKVNFSSLDSNSNSNSGLFQSPLPRRSIWLDPATSRTFGLQQHRQQAFTEEVASFKVPLKANRRQKAHAMVVFPDHSVHGEVLLIDLLGMIACNWLVCPNEPVVVLPVQY